MRFLAKLAYHLVLWTICYWAVMTCAYRFKHPEKTETQVFLNSWDILKGDFSE
jgi:hypothetical protein